MSHDICIKMSCLTELLRYLYLYFFTFLRLFDLFSRWNSVESSTISLDSSFHSCFRAYPVNSAKGFIWEVDSSSDYMARLLPYTPPRTAHYAHCTSNLNRKICSKMLFERRQPTSHSKKLVEVSQQEWSV